MQGKAIFLLKGRMPQITRYMGVCRTNGTAGTTTEMALKDFLKCMTLFLSSNSSQAFYQCPIEIPSLCYTNSIASKQVSPIQRLTFIHPHKERSKSSVL